MKDDPKGKAEVGRLEPCLLRSLRTVKAEDWSPYDDM